MVAIIDYSAGNLISVKRALEHLNIDCLISSESKQILDADHIIFPGVGHAFAAMGFLKQRNLDKTLKDAFTKGIPILGICLGTQIILSHSEEGNTQCLGLIEGNCPKFKLPNSDLKIPHMGWNSIRLVQQHPVFEGIKDVHEFYFVHSFYPVPNNNEQIIGLCNYGINFPTIVGHKNLIATQFHPEKSGKAGLMILKNFSNWNGVRC
ncbi:Imidazole glycerol phosphate synthase amidotransferase subunit [Chitinispirillum alkaliphilum]|nr:Imidazole glycerol phosphate synthase amidotransferase subunit [Chitinispirillum alkaliphilum]